MPDDWANWKGTWDDLAKTYGLKHIDTDMSSAQEIAKFAAEKDNASADIGDVGAAFGPIAVKQGVAQPYKPTTWAQVPDWAKDKDGNWALAYTGTIAFIVNKKLLHGSEAPTSWADLNLDLHAIADYIRETYMGVNSIGTTLRGIGPAYSSRAERTNLIVADLFEDHVLEKNMRFLATRFSSSHGVNKIDYDVEEEISQLKVGWSIFYFVSEPTILLPHSYLLCVQGTS